MQQPLVRVIFATILSVLCVTPASAAWHKAESDRFVIYADDSPKDIKRFSENLERYHKAMELITNRKVDVPSPSGRVTIFVAGNQRDIRKLSGGKSRSVAGFYIPRASGSTAFVQDIQNKNGYPHISTTILLHEYAHHFLISTTRFSMPRWLSEGAAEFFASASFKKDGGMMIGSPARHRAGELAFADNVTLLELLDHELYEKNKGKRYDAFYGRSWQLYHYLYFNDARKGQLANYWQGVATGQSSMEAAKANFGDLEVLQRELKAYGRQRRVSQWNIKPKGLPIRPVRVTKLSKGEAEMMEVRMRSQRGVDEEQAAELIVEARKIAAYFPNDPGAQTVLAEAEFDAGNLDAAIIAADKAIAADPARANAYVQKGYALFAKAEDAEDQAAAYKKAMAPFSKLNSMETDHPLPLIYYYRSFTEQGKSPPENARHALERAAELAPFDKGLWLQVALMQFSEGKNELAKLSLMPIANDPHGGGASSAAKRLIARIETSDGGGAPDDEDADADDSSAPDTAE